MASRKPRVLVRPWDQSILPPIKPLNYGKCVNRMFTGPPDTERQRPLITVVRSIIVAWHASECCTCQATGLASWDLGFVHEHELTARHLPEASALASLAALHRRAPSLKQR